MIALVAFEYYYLPYSSPIRKGRHGFIRWLQEQEDQESIRLINLPMGRSDSKLYAFHQSLSGYPHVEGLAARTPPTAYNYIRANFLLDSWSGNTGIVCTTEYRKRFLSALDQLTNDGLSHLVLHTIHAKSEALQGSFIDIVPAYQDKYATIYRLEELRDSCIEPVTGRGPLALYLSFFFSSPMNPRYETILSFHPTESFNEDAFLFYSKMSSEWKSLVHISHDDRNEINIQSSRSEMMDLDSIISANDAIWLINNPQQTNLQAIDAYIKWFTRYYRPCKRFLEKENIVIDYYLRDFIPCELIDNQSPLEVVYENGNKLFNVSYEIRLEQMSFYLWWSETDTQHDAYSIQIFDEQNQKVQQIDHVISLEPLAVHNLDISILAVGEYVAKLIVYDYATGASRSGTIIGNQQHFEREVEIARFTISN